MWWKSKHLYCLHLYSELRQITLNLVKCLAFTIPDMSKPPSNSHARSQTISLSYSIRLPLTYISSMQHLPVDHRASLHCSCKLGLGRRFRNLIFGNKRYATTLGIWKLGQLSISKKMKSCLSTMSKLGHWVTQLSRYKRYRIWLSKYGCDMCYSLVSAQSVSSVYHFAFDFSPIRALYFLGEIVVW